jgi:hypothetical protein
MGWMLELSDECFLASGGMGAAAVFANLPLAFAAGFFASRPIGFRA